MSTRPSPITILPKPEPRDAARRTYLEEGRRAVRAWLDARVRGPDPAASAERALRLGLAPERLVALWTAEDLFADPALELAARAGYPQLAAVFAALDAARRNAALHDEEARGEGELRAVLARLGPG